MKRMATRDYSENHVATFHRTSTDHYAQWKNSDLLALGLETMPKQVDKLKALHNVKKLRSGHSQILIDAFDVSSPGTSVETTSSKHFETRARPQRLSASIKVYSDELYTSLAQGVVSIKLRKTSNFQKFLPFSVGNSDTEILRFDLGIDSTLSHLAQSMSTRPLTNALNAGLRKNRLARASKDLV